MIDILQFLPPRTRKSPSGWFTFNAPCCPHNGESQDKRKRGGMILDGNDWSFHCFNCGFKTRFVSGQKLSFKSQKFLSWLGVDKQTIQRISLDSLKNKKIYDIAKHRAVESEEIVRKNIFFNDVRLPSSARGIISSDTWAIEYLKEKRGLDYRDYPYKVTPNAVGRDARRIIIPYKYASSTVGWTSRYLDRSVPKYKNEGQQPGYVFGLDMQHNDWDYIIVMEGIFDAISLSGVAVLHNEISDKQMAILRRQGKEIIVVPDMDKAGIGLIESALAEGFSISTPTWDKGVKDVNDAVMKYGKLGTLLSILNNKTSSKIRGKLAITNLKKRLKIND